MPSGSDPTDFISTMGDLRLRLADMEEQILDDTYADLLLSSFPKEFAFIRQMHHRDRSFTLGKIKRTRRAWLQKARTRYLDKTAAAISL